MYPFQIDDSYISLRYARNLATGFGIVFNLDGPRILREMREYVISQNPDFIIQDKLSLLEDQEVLARYEPMGIEFVYYEAYKCGRQQFCSYVLKPWKRRDIR